MARITIARVTKTFDTNLEIYVDNCDLKFGRVLVKSN